MTESSPGVGWDGVLGWKRGLTKGHECTFVGDGLCSPSWIVVMVSQVFTYVKSHQTIHTKYAQFIVCQWHHSKSVQNKTEQ